MYGIIAKLLVVLGEHQWTAVMKFLGEHQWT